MFWEIGFCLVYLMIGLGFTSQFNALYGTHNLNVLLWPFHVGGNICKWLFVMRERGQEMVDDKNEDQLIASFGSAHKNEAPPTVH